MNRAGVRVRRTAMGRSVVAALCRHVVLSDQ